jgi:hypothetical protein
MMRKTISFTDAYTEEYKYLCGQGNASEYMCKLIRKDRLNSAGGIEDRILKLLQSILSSGALKPAAENLEAKRSAASKILSIGRGDK